MKETFKLSGRVHVVHKDSTGAVISDFEQPNLIVTTGITQISQLIANNVAVTAPTHMAVGTNAGAPSAGETTLVTEVGRVALTSTTAGASTIVYVATFLPGVGTGNLNEGGLFNAGAAGTMTCRTLFAATVPKAAGDTVEVTWTITVG